MRLSMAKKNDGGFQSQAGLVRYFDTENDKSIKISPRAVIAIAIGFVVVVLLLQTFAPMS
jgi:preprotein translocase subunit Sec61beta